MAQLSILRVITELARRDPDRPAVHDSTRALTRRELDERTNGLARTYAELGVRVGGLVTIALPNGADCVAEAERRHLAGRLRPRRARRARPARRRGAARASPLFHNGLFIYAFRGRVT